MKKKIIGMFVCILLVATVVPGVESLKNSKITPMAPSSISQSCSVVDWIEEKAPSLDGQEGDNFGCYASLSGDTALIGAWLDGDNGYHSGSAYVFIRNNTTWTQQAKLLPSDGEEDNLFGWSVSLDNDTALIGAYWDDDNGDKSGSAYVFTRNGTKWTQQAKLLASDGTIMDYFGYSVLLSGNTACISAPIDDDNGDASGSAYIFTRTGNNWTQQAKLIAADGATGDNFGFRVFLAGNTALIGAQADDDVRGSAYGLPVPILPGPRRLSSWPQTVRVTTFSVILFLFPMILLSSELLVIVTMETRLGQPMCSPVRNHLDPAAKTSPERWLCMGLFWLCLFRQWRHCYRLCASG